MLERSLTYHLAVIAEDGIGAADAIFRSRFGWSVRELRVLRLVAAEPGITFTALARATAFERTLTSRILTKLIRAGLVERTGSPTDGRIFTLSVTKAGSALCRRADPLTTELEALMLTPLSDRERKALMTMLDRLRSWVQGGYGDEVSERYTEARGGRRRAS